MTDKKEQPSPSEEMKKVFDRFLKNIKRRAAENDRNKKAGGGLANE